MRKIKIDKSLARLTRGHGDSIQINKIRNEKGDKTTGTGNSKKNHQILLQEFILNKVWKSGWNGQLSRYIPCASVKKASDKPSK